MRRLSLSVRVLLDVDVECAGFFFSGAGEGVSLGTASVVFESGKIGLCNGMTVGGLFSDGLVI